MNEAADIIRRTHAKIVATWEAQVVVDVPELATLSRAMLIDHLPEFLEGFARWLEGDAGDGFRALADGHALSRQSSGVGIDVLMAEYACLRRTLVDQVLCHSAGEHLVRAVTSLNSGMDLAIAEAVRRYVGARDDVRQRFIAILGHDLRDPLAAVQLSASVLATGQLPEPQQRVVERIARAAGRMERMISDVLDFTRGPLSGAIPVSLAAVDMADICRSAVEEANAAGNTAIRFEATGNLLGMWDSDRVQQALSNLLRNARHHGGGEVELRAWESEDRKKVYTAITNHGPMIPPAQLPTLFDPYTRPSETRSRGLGLGLFIVREIARAHGGICSAESTAESTTFLIEWPRMPFENTADRT
jgi:signal transduction histidine kinase